MSDVSVGPGPGHKQTNEDPKSDGLGNKTFGEHAANQPPVVQPEGQGGQGSQGSQEEPAAPAQPSR